MDDAAIIAETQRWIEAIVIGLNLCPFARRPFDAGAIRYVVSTARDEGALLAHLETEARLLTELPAETVETSLLIHPYVLGDFLDYNDFLERAEALLVELDLEGVLQVASFHPAYQFADTDPDAVENYTNRSPYPMLHLLREDSITAIAEDEERLLEIPQRNIETLRALGKEEILARLRALRSSPPG